MTKFNDIERQAGTLMLSNLKMFNEAVVTFEQYIDPAFWKGFDLCVERFKKENNWAGEIGMAQKDYLWLAPSSWVIETDNCKYWFENDSITSEDGNYYIALLTQSHIGQGAFGFKFKLAPSWFGGTRKMNTYINSTDQKYRTQLVELGFQDQGKGNFFLPLTLDINQMAECWKEHGAFPTEHEVFIPLHHSLEKLAKSVAIFDSTFSAFVIESE
ncbi:MULTISPECIES: hypothetical protein [Morganellaceae]|uniref:hypothetical protein n=1 Tax=Morganellaceae TaxID=1903414 RepID=UPI0020259766|nr:MULTISPECIES: hypothetical protein [Morganellaceae]MCL8621703.1 hypothetical protein [Proteus mirabilis]MCL8632825.1 hypothetical protein [Proteus mirabilis]HCT3785149.1 hypothetical protein [Proteus mirabilis]